MLKSKTIVVYIFVLFLLVILLSALLRLTLCDYPFGIFKLLLQCLNLLAFCWLSYCLYLYFHYYFNFFCCVFTLCTNEYKKWDKPKEKRKFSVKYGQWLNTIL